MDCLAACWMLLCTGLLCCELLWMDMKVFEERSDVEVKFGNL